MSIPTRKSAARPSPLRVLGDRRASLIGAAVAAILAAILFAVAMHSDASPAKTTSSSAVFATRLIHRGTLLDARVLGSSARVRTVGAAARAPGALSTLDAVRGQVASADIAAGTQLTSSDLGDDSGAITTRLAGRNRAVSVPIDRAHGMVGDISTGDHVDVYGSFEVQLQGDSRPHPVLKVLAQNVRVLREPTAGSADTGDTPRGQITMELRSSIAQQVAFSADNGKLWIAARPTHAARHGRPKLVTLESLLLGANPRTALKGTQ